MRLPLDRDAALDLAADPDAPTRAHRTVTRRRTGPFVNAASTGLAVAAAHRARPLKRGSAPLAYAVGGAARGAHRATRSRCASRADGAEAFAGEAWQVIVGGTGAFGGGSRLGRARRAATSSLDVAIVKRGSRAVLVLRAWGMRRGTLEEQRGVRHVRATARRDRGRRRTPSSTSTARSAPCAPPNFDVQPGGVEVVRPAMNKRWPAGIAVAGRAGTPATRCAIAASRATGYDLHGDALDVGSREFLRACEALTGAACDARRRRRAAHQRRQHLPRLPGDDPRGASRRINCLTYVYWRGDIAREVAGALADRARDGLEVNVLLDAVGTREDGARPPRRRCATAA